MEVNTATFVNQLSWKKTSAASKSLDPELPWSRPYNELISKSKYILIEQHAFLSHKQLSNKNVAQ